jgi:hypothetical protein
MSEKKRNFLKFIKSGTYTDKSGTRTNTDRAASRVKKIDLDLETMKPASTKKMLTGGQAKIAAKAPPPNVINEKDFKVLRAEKAKGRGMGLQDEKVKPGKVQKANLGLMFMKKAKDKGAKGLEFLSPLAMLKRFSGKKAGGVMKAKLGAEIKPQGPAVLRPKPTGQGGKPLKPKPIKPNKKMGGGMMQRPMGYSKGGGFDAGTPGKIRDLMKQTKVKGKMFNANNLTKKDFEKLKKVKMSKVITSDKYMGGGMMQKPMGYKEGRSISTRGGGVDSSIIGRLRDAGPFKRIPLGKSRLTDKDRKNLRDTMQKRSSRKSALDFAKRVTRTVASVASPVTAAGSAAYKLAKKMKDKDRLTDRDIQTARSAVGMGSKNRPIKKDHSSRNPNPKTPKMMGGGMMQKPMGYKSGTMIKARGCKLGRTRPTKIT